MTVQLHPSLHIPVGTWIKEEIIDPRRLTVAAAAGQLKVDRRELGTLLNGESNLSADMATRLETAFGVKAETLMRMQAAYACVYPATLEPDDNDTVLVTFPDLPGVTFGTDREDALAHAVDCLETILDAMMADGVDLPTPSPAEGRPMVTLGPSASIKVAIYRAKRV